MVAPPVEVEALELAGLHPDLHFMVARYYFGLRPRMEGKEMTVDSLDLMGMAY